MEIPAGISITYGGDTEMMAETFRELDRPCSSPSA